MGACLLKFNRSGPAESRALLKPALSSAIAALRFSLLFALSLCLSGCEVERRKSNAELGLSPQQAEGRRIYDDNCDRCHAPYSSKNRQGPSLKQMFKKTYLEQSGLPANDDRVSEIIRLGRDKMPGFGQALSERQVDQLLAYLHTL